MLSLLHVTHRAAQSPSRRDGAVYRSLNETRRVSSIATAAVESASLWRHCVCCFGHWKRSLTPRQRPCCPRACTGRPLSKLLGEERRLVGSGVGMGIFDFFSRLEASAKVAEVQVPHIAVKADASGNVWLMHRQGRRVTDHATVFGNLHDCLHRGHGHA